MFGRRVINFEACTVPGVTMRKFTKKLRVLLVLQVGYRFKTLNSQKHKLLQYNKFSKR